MNEGEWGVGCGVWGVGCGVWVVCHCIPIIKHLSG